jgi:hypothetical protein
LYVLSGDDPEDGCSCRVEGVVVVVVVGDVGHEDTSSRSRSRRLSSEFCDCDDSWLEEDSISIDDDLQLSVGSGSVEESE